MTHVRLASLALAGALLSLPSPAAADKPLAPVRAATAQLDAAVQAWFEGADAEAAFSPWVAAVRERVAEPSIPEQIRAAGGAKLELLAFELEVTLQDGAGKTLEAKAVVFSVGDRAGLLELRVHDESLPDGTLIAAASPKARPLARAASALADELLSPRCAELWVPDPAERWPGSVFAERGRGPTERLRASLPELCARFAVPGLQATHFDVDDFGYVVRGPEGEYVGVFEGELELDGDLVVAELNRFDLLPPPASQAPTLDANKVPRGEP